MFIGLKQPYWFERTYTINIVIWGTTFLEHFHLKSSWPWTLQSIEVWVNRRYYKQNKTLDLLSCKIWNVLVIRASSWKLGESSSVKSELFSYNLHGLYLIYVCSWGQAKSKAVDLVWLLLVNNYCYWLIIKVLFWILHTLKRILENELFCSLLSYAII